MEVEHRLLRKGCKHSHIKNVLITNLMLAPITGHDDTESQTMQISWKVQPAIAARMKVYC